MNDELLKKHFNFDEADLYANRHGALTPKQQTRLAKEVKAAKKAARIIGLILLFIAISPTMILTLVGAPMFFLIIWTLVWGSIWGLLGFFSIRSGLSTQAVYKLTRVEGPINIVKVETSSGDQDSFDYELRIGGVSFDVEPELANIMMQGDFYTINFVEGPGTVISKEIVSVEMLAKAE